MSSTTRRKRGKPESNIKNPATKKKKAEKKSIKKSAKEIEKSLKKDINNELKIEIEQNIKSTKYKFLEDASNQC